jgi:glutamate racemase
MSGNQPIGVFDSGLGGLSVLKEVRFRLPEEDLVYIADSAYCPYGERSLEEIQERSIRVTEALIGMGAKLIIVACNTATGAAIDTLREKFDLPIVGLEPAVKPAAASTNSGRIAVLATPATLKTERFNRLVDDHGSEVDVIKIPCPGFVELVEAGELSGERALSEIRGVLAPLTDSQVDRIVLGCTHYPFLRESVAEVVGEGVEIMDSGAAVARQVERVLMDRSSRAGNGAGTLKIFTTGEAEEVRPVAERLWGSPLEVNEVSA